MNLRNSLKTLLVLVLGLPILLAVLGWVAGLFAAMGDDVTAKVLGHISTGARVIWLVCLVAAVVVLAMQSLELTREE
ncbi:hypothetical protein [Bythopirellula goksoeyrii]|uniref:Uncharacterized protein n=1 Tax=Bythopirellula goksoeyrii TaxID=1400387 RepID=A0A5B9Q1U0_9BACT|nr:hypothetical protein [Bythopirellula goksoeyrii]QEG33007.1 hypothetical protein Pr1d_02680 [Bythopirellula goksoeyrii]